MHHFPASHLRRDNNCMALSASTPQTGHSYEANRWHNAVSTLANLHRIDVNAVDLSNYGKDSDFFNRQLKTLGRVSESQARAIDIETKKQVGKIPHYDNMVAFFTDPKTQPKDRATLIHGDYKIDNLVYHKTESKIIGILE